MAPEKKRPGDRRRQRKRRPKAKVKPEFTRPREWAKSELDGVKVWLARLKSPGASTYPAEWREGMIKHYTARAKELRAEIKAHTHPSKPE